MVQVRRLLDVLPILTGRQDERRFPCSAVVRLCVNVRIADPVELDTQRQTTARVISFTDRPFNRGGGSSRTAQYGALVVVVVAALQNGEHTGLEEVDQTVLTGDAAGPQAR